MSGGEPWRRLRVIRERREERARRALVEAKRQRQARLDELEDIESRCAAHRRARQRAASTFLARAEQHPVSRQQIERSHHEENEYDDKIEHLMQARVELLDSMARLDAYWSEKRRLYHARQRETAALNEILGEVERNRMHRAEALWQGGYND